MTNNTEQSSRRGRYTMHYILCGVAALDGDVPLRHNLPGTPEREVAQRAV